MKGITIALCAMLLAFNANAQKCKYVSNKKDPVTGEVSKTNQIKFEKTYYLIFNKNGDKFNFELDFIVGGAAQYSIEAGVELLLKTGAGNTITLKSEAPAAPNTYWYSNILVTNFRPKFYVSKEQLQEIATSGIIAISPRIRDLASLVREFSSKQTKHSLENAACLLSNE